MFYSFLGTEYTNNQVQDLLRSEGITHFIAYSPWHASDAEIYKHTLKNKIYKYFRENLTYNWVDVLQEITDQINDTIHSRLHRRPSEINKSNERHIYEDYYKPLINESPPEFKYQVGDKVRLSIGRHPFRRAFHQAWTEEIYTIAERINSNPPRYVLKDLHNERFKSSVYEPELQKVNQSDQTSLFRIAKLKSWIIGQKTNRNR